MKHITIEECPINMGAKQWIDGYNTAREEANKLLDQKDARIAELKGRINAQSNTIHQFQLELMNRENPSQVEKRCHTCDHIVTQANCPTCDAKYSGWQPQVKVEPETLTIHEMVRNLTNRIEKLEHDNVPTNLKWNNQSRYNNELLERIEKLE